MPFVLVALEGTRKGETFPVEDGRAITLGRDTSNTICLPDRKLSRVHCQVAKVGDKCRVIDLNSTNGTKVNGERIADEVMIDVGDEIAIGISKLRLAEIEDGPESAVWQPRVNEIRCEECGQRISKDDIAGGQIRYVGSRHYCAQCSASFMAPTVSADGELEPVGEEFRGIEQGTEIASVRVISLIGEGRLGPLYKGEQTRMGRLVALKVLNVTDGEWARIYLKAVYSSGQLVHPGIVLIFDTGEADGRFYIVREYVEGQSLQHLLSNREPVPLARAAAIVTETAYALEHAFERHIFHGGLSPRKILLGPQNTVKVTGFGLPGSLPAGQPASRHTWHALPYTPPERLREGAAIDFAGDVYSLVAVFYHLLTGRPPFGGSTREKAERRILKRAPKPVNMYNPDLPPVVQKIVDRGLSKDPRARYQLPREFLYELEEHLRAEM